jgi:hypothetical protein
MTDLRNERRSFILQGCAAAAGSILGAGILSRAEAGEHAAHGALGHGSAEGYVMDSQLAKHCATCEYWGGSRRVSQDGKTLLVTGLGWCNNPNSRNYQKLTSPEHGPMDAWKKWQVLG